MHANLARVGVQTTHARRGLGASAAFYAVRWAPALRAAPAYRPAGRRPGRGAVGERCPVYELLVLFMAYTGLRAAEVQGLEVRDLAPTTGHGTMRRAVDYSGPRHAASRMGYRHA